MCIFVLQFLLALNGGAFGLAWLLQFGCEGDQNHVCHDKVNYLPNEEHIDVWTYIRIAGTWVLMFTNLVPISLMVTIELVNFWQAMFMGYDCRMFDRS